MRKQSGIRKPGRQDVIALPPSTGLQDIRNLAVHVGVIIRVGTENSTSARHSCGRLQQLGGKVGRFVSTAAMRS